MTKRNLTNQQPKRGCSFPWNTTVMNPFGILLQRKINSERWLQAFQQTRKGSGNTRFTGRRWITYYSIFVHPLIIRQSSKANCDPSPPRRLSKHLAYKNKKSLILSSITSRIMAQRRHWRKNWKWYCAHNLQIDF